MKDVMGIIYTGENDTRLRELTMLRAIAALSGSALPVAGRETGTILLFVVGSVVHIILPR